MLMYYVHMRLQSLHHAGIRVQARSKQERP